MSTQEEQYRSLLRTKRLLTDLMTAANYPKTKREMRERVYGCLRHFPFLAENGRPMFSVWDKEGDK